MIPLKCDKSSVSSCVWLAIGLTLVVPGIAQDSIVLNAPKSHQSNSAIEMFPGVMEPHQVVEMSVPVDGLLMKVHVTEGDFIEQNQILSVMDNRVATAAVRAARTQADRKAEFQRASLNLAQAKKQFRRIYRVKSSVSELELDQAEAALNLAQAELDRVIEDQNQYRAELLLARARLEALNVVAPIDGQILKVVGRAGQSMIRSDQLLTIANLSKLRADVHVPISWFGHFRPGDQCKLIASNPVSKVIPAKIIFVEPRIDSGTQTFRCTVEVENPNSQYPAGFTVRLVHPQNNSKSFIQYSIPESK